VSGHVRSQVLWECLSCDSQVASIACCVASSELLTLAEAVSLSINTHLLITLRELIDLIYVQLLAHSWLIVGTLQMP
jgi:hypothetical protein